MVKKKNSLEKLGLGSSIILFLLSWIGLLGSSFLFSLEVLEIIQNTTPKGLFFLPIYFAGVFIYVLLTLAFASRINRIGKENAKKNGRGKSRKTKRWIW